MEINYRYCSLNIDPLDLKLVLIQPRIESLYDNLMVKTSKKHKSQKWRGELKEEKKSKEHWEHDSPYIKYCSILFYLYVIIFIKNKSLLCLYIIKIFIEPHMQRTIFLLINE